MGEEPKKGNRTTNIPAEASSARGLSPDELLLRQPPERLRDLQIDCRRHAHEHEHGIDPPDRRDGIRPY